MAGEPMLRVYRGDDAAVSGVRRLASDLVGPDAVRLLLGQVATDDAVSALRAQLLALADLLAATAQIAQDAKAAAQAAAGGAAAAAAGADRVAQDLASRLPVPIAATVPIGVLGIGKTVRMLTGIAGIRAGDRLLITPRAPVGTAYTLTQDTYAPADGQVSVTLDVIVALTVPSTTLPVLLTAFR